MERSFQDSLRYWRTKLKELAEQRDHIEADIAKAEPVVKALAQSIEDRTEREKLLAEVESLVKPEGFTDAISRILRESRPNALTPPEIRDRMIEGGFNLSGYKSPLASIHAILIRLRKRMVIKRRVQGDQTVYEWIGE